MASTHNRVEATRQCLVASPLAGQKGKRTPLMSNASIKNFRA